MSQWRIDTPPLPNPPRPTEAYLGTITAVEVKQSKVREDGTGGEYHYFEMQLTPEGIEAGPFIDRLVFKPEWFGSDFDVSTLNEKEKTVYRINISNDDNRATLQILRGCADAQGRSLTVNGGTQTDFLDAAVNYLTGTVVGFVRAVDKRDQQKRMSVARYFPPEDATNPKRLRGIRKMWE